MSYLGLSEVPVDNGATFSWHSEQESMFQEVLAKLRARRSSVWAALLLVGSLVAFILVQRSNETTLADVLVLTGVLAFHEAGHFVAMRALGYRDVKMFFIPFFGAAVTGRRTGGAAWKEAVVLLAGPVPGVIVGAVMIVSGSADLSPTTGEVAYALLAINGFNLLPLVPLDGGKLLENVLFGGRRALVVPFQLAAAVGLACLSAKLHAQALQWLGFLLVMGAAFRWRLLGAAAQVRKTGLAVPVDARDLDGESGRRVFAAARNALSEQRRDRVGEVASAVEELVEVVSHQRPTFGAAAGLLLAWLFSLVVSVLAFGGPGLTVASLGLRPSADWQQITEPVSGWTAQFPGSPATKVVPGADLQAPAVTVKLLMGDHTGYFVISAPVGLGVPSFASMADVFEQKLAASNAKGANLPAAVRTQVSFAGEKALRLDYRAPNHPESTVVFLDHAGRRFLVFADGQYSTRFLESFRWNPEPQPR